jgi:hypothetical protein
MNSDNWSFRDFCSVILHRYLIEILNFRKGATVINLNAAVTNFMSHCKRDKSMGNKHLTG